MINPSFKPGLKSNNEVLIQMYFVTVNFRKAAYYCLNLSSLFLSL